jgi:hypothetical protein
VSWRTTHLSSKPVTLAIKIKFVLEHFILIL